MLTYRDEDNKWENWDGGYWGKDIDNSQENKNNFKICKIGCIVCCMVFLLTLPIMYIITDGKFICDIPYLPLSDFCENKITKNSINNTSIVNSTIYNNLLNNSNITNITGIRNSLNLTNNTMYDNSQNNNDEASISNSNQSFYPYNMVVNTSNFTNALLYQTQVKENIEDTSTESVDMGRAMAISIGSVFGFIIFILGSIYFLKSGHKNMKNYCTNKTASKHNDIKLTEEELKFYEVKNPIQEAFKRNEGGFFQKGVVILKKAIEKDRARDFEEAIILYNDGIEYILKSLKSTSNANDRFLIAKKIDIYVQRVNYITNCVQNKILVGDIKYSNKTK